MKTVDRRLIDSGKRLALPLIATLALLGAASYIGKAAHADPTADTSAIPVPHHRLNRLVTGWLPEWLNIKGPGAVIAPAQAGDDDGWHAVYSNIDIMDQVDLCSGTLHEKTGAWNVDFGTTRDVVNREIAIMHDNGVMAMFLMSLDGSVHALLAKPQEQAVVIDKIAHTLDAYDLDGVDLDIEDFDDHDPGDTARYTAFVTALVERLHQRMDSFGYPTTVSPTVIVRTDRAQYAYADETVLANSGVDSVRVMVYDENYDGGPHAGATGPLPWMHTVANYLHHTGAPNWKYLIGIPSYGYDWPVKSAGDWTTTATGDSFSYSQSMAEMAKYHAAPQWSQSDQAPYFTYVKDGKNRVGFFEDARSWELKLAEIVEPGDANSPNSSDTPFGGIAEWAFGMEPANSWNVVRSTFHSAYPICGVIGECYGHIGGGARLGNPAAPEEDAGAPESGRMNGRAGRMQRFQEGTIFYRWDATRAYYVSGAILSQYATQDGPAGKLGFPISDATFDSSGRQTQQFAGGALSSSEDTPN